jgi:hypothetical protein
MADKKTSTDKSKKEGKPKKNITIIPEVLDDKALTPAEQEKVEEAYNELKNIFFNNIYKSMLEAGQYLIETFFENDYVKAVEKPFNENSSLHALFQKLNTDTSGSAPKKTWLYDSINLAIAEDNFKDVSAFGKLNNSHKLKVISSGLSKENQLMLIEEIFKEQYTVLALKARIEELRKNPNKTNRQFLSLDMEIPQDKLKKLNIERLEKYIAEIKEFQESFEQKKIIYDTNRQTIEQILEKKKANKEKKDKKEKKAADSKTS